MADRTLQGIDELKLLGNSKIVHYFVKDPQVRKAVVKYLCADGCTHKEIAHALKISTSTVSKDVKGEGTDIESALVQILEDQEVSKLQFIKSKILTEIDSNEKIKKLSAAQMAYVYGILTDKHRLLQNKSTANISVAVQTLTKLFEDEAGNIKKDLDNAV